jgi:hypothetical protein
MLSNVGYQSLKICNEGSKPQKVHYICLPMKLNERLEEKFLKIEADFLDFSPVERQ